MEVETASGPSPPIKFYDNLSFNFTQKQLDDAAKTNKTAKIAGEDNGKHLVEVFSSLERTAIRVVGGVMKTTDKMQISLSGSLEWNGRVSALCLDRNEVGWVAVQRYAYILQ
jgi:hypothetical protein